MNHWSCKYIGEPYIPNEADCARLVARIRVEVFKQPIPSAVDVERAASRLGRAAQLKDAVEHYGELTTEPTEGDAVLMYCAGRPSHIGVFCVVDGERYVLHAMENAGMIVLHRLRDLPKVFLTVEGYYKWK